MSLILTSLFILSLCGSIVFATTSSSNHQILQPEHPKSSSKGGGEGIAQGLQDNKNNASYSRIIQKHREFTWWKVLSCLPQLVFETFKKAWYIYFDGARDEQAELVLHEEEQKQTEIDESMLTDKLDPQEKVLINPEVNNLYQGRKQKSL